ncbi:hypothetical protein A3G67_03745 [Candidatus Roizmanbacteria bacterium RIFCSPLOWO2_12_FULL_40_12]|uniref:Mannosylglycerate hydrolase MGH1-like glycoside hydrolase domain-containing protein n=1 Tax=Candidatus Roizmanbacteria bacterium RIFCSPLOWO2_01_FULL_40_42 TaxID=1802066 RepID=A0A1F7J5P8_9BACT|nr:MAG: hypothetical protein A2779_03380 [Candidatus Roizmanbacteria bacterium RIFCSPHIGHO2_01_FULL_40_98]OGK28378.1 MAG: hypothetical protein A3C31_00745 [Candidatus Roizmanbacteria bacterium RIFCSPHIGHO2_02_FULL_40_53]OGK30614.1 MAG: hypothetical protein A2W49_03430 [Candidatus Roizmanbacteria bacterium RIFCSPHIGHO2_12_41_18]OGK37028.1 MAG: hypothetical protein A3E69_01005 [Candidatus Roizmanbacteria bacterium RIFCSPHIGHO2_12_FULL_40_130]OGK50934.1 MAG: hypothetical protein A3B50_01515 [Candi
MGGKKIGNEELRKDLTKKAQTVFDNNTFQGFSKWKNAEYSFIAPSDREYIYQFLWDTGFHAIVLSHFDIPKAKEEIRTFLLGQWNDGFLPHVIFWGEKKVLSHWAYIESKPSVRPHTTAISQPPVLALAIESIYKKSKDKKFLEETLPKIANHHRWLLANRDEDGDKLISIISPNESGMDELPVFQYVTGFLGEDVVRLHWTYRKTDLRNYYHNYDNKTILEKDYFNVEELLFNCVFAEASRSLSRLFSEIGNKEESSYFKMVSDKTEEAIIKKCWHKEDEIFYSLFTHEEKFARVKTVASLIPLFLENLKGEKLEKLINKHLLNKSEFWTRYPVPTVARSEPYYNPADTPIHKVKLLWRGPTWIATNWFVVKGLQKHGYHDIAEKIIITMNEMITQHGFREYYNPETGEGYRRVNFGWSTLLLDLL